MMALQGIVFVTSSTDKHREAVQILGLPMPRVDLDLPEAQGLDVVAIAREKSRAAQRRLKHPVLVEDTSLELSALGGFPGPLIRWLLQAAGPEAIARILDPFADRGARARCAAVVWDGRNEWLGVGEVRGTIASQARGTHGFGWDVVFVPEWGNGRTYAELAPEEKNARSHRTLALAALRERLHAR
jgi:non-canonical purine NTP pyrophosphatase (RdgB/HAM1 family)